MSLTNESSSSGRLWKCLCDCGNTYYATSNRLKSGNTKSCGCLLSEILINRNKDASKHDMTKTREFISWDSMKQRCLNPNHKSYKDYGGRGITIYGPWISDFSEFYSFMGNRPEGTTLERIDNDKGYFPGNCVWKNSKEQANNRRNTFWITALGVTKTCSEWSEETGIGQKTILYRIKSGWKPDLAVTLKPDRRNRNGKNTQ